MDDQPVLLDVSDDGIARLTLNRPDAANAIDRELAEGLARAAGSLADSRSARVVLLTGRGQRFCGGGDVRSFGEAGAGLPDRLREIVDPLHDGIEALAQLDAPIIAAVQGSAAGAGLALVAMADLVLAAASTKFVMAYTAIGLNPDGGSTWFLPRVVGMRRAVELALTNRALTASEALEWGLVSRVVDDDALTSEAEELATALAAGPTRAFGVAKQLLRASLGATLPEQLAREGDELVAAGARHDAQEGVAAFVEKRAARFDGRDV